MRAGVYTVFFGRSTGSHGVPTGGGKVAGGERTRSTIGWRARRTVGAHGVVTSARPTECAPVVDFPRKTSRGNTGHVPPTRRPTLPAAASRQRARAPPIRPLSNRPNFKFKIVNDRYSCRRRPSTTFAPKTSSARYKSLFF